MNAYADQDTTESVVIEEHGWTADKICTRRNYQKYSQNKLIPKMFNCLELI